MFFLDVEYCYSCIYTICTSNNILCNNVYHTWICTNLYNVHTHTCICYGVIMFTLWSSPYTGELRTGTRVGRAKFMQCLEWCMSVSKVAARVKLFWYITRPLFYCVVKYWPRPPSYCWNMASSPMHIWKQKTQKAVIKPQLFSTVPGFSKTR